MTANELRKKAYELELDNKEILDKYTDDDLEKIYNGIGPDSFPEWLRNAVSALHPTLEVAAFIHDVEWHESDGSREKFYASNNRFKRNGYAAAKARYSCLDPRRYIVMNQARRFGNLCGTLFGLSAWQTPCTCDVCKSSQKTGKEDVR